MQTTAMARRRRTRILVAVAVLAATAGGCTGGGESVISGIGNSGNRIGPAEMWQLLAEQLVASELTPRVTDDDVRQIFATIRTRALEGEVEAALVVLKVAEKQRESD